MARRALLAGLVVAVLVGLALTRPTARPPGGTAGSSAPTASPSFRTLTATGTTGQHETVLVPPGTVTGLVVFMHGYASDDRQVLVDDELFPVRDALLGQGRAIASSDAHGDNMGSAESLADQAALVARLRPDLPVGSPVDVLAFSMGGLDALESVGRGVLPGVHAVALLSGACDQGTYVDGRYRNALLRAFPGPPAQLADRVAQVSVRDLPAQAFSGVLLHFWAGEQDTTVPMATQTLPCLERLERSAASSLTVIGGAHGTLTDVAPADVLALFG